jgi:hypothetical protein
MTALDVPASEWTKVRSVGSTYWLLAVAAVTAIGGSAIVALSDWGSAKPAPLDPVASVFLAWLDAAATPAPARRPRPAPRNARTARPTTRSRPGRTVCTLPAEYPEPRPACGTAGREPFPPPARRSQPGISGRCPAPLRGDPECWPAVGG